MTDVLIRDIPDDVIAALDALAAGDASESVFAAIDDGETSKYTLEHHDVVARFGRFPHRNEVLGRENTPEELDYLKTAERFGQ